MKGFHARVVVLAVLGCTALSSGCLPLPPAETAAICNTAPSGPPTADDLAGLRVGYGIAHPEVADLMNRVRQPFNVSSVALAAAEASGDDDILAEALATAVRKEIQASTQLVVDDVVIAEAGTIPKTSSGKVQRSKARALYESGELKKKTPEGNIGIAKHVLKSQLAHLKLSIFGAKKSAMAGSPTQPRARDASVMPSWLADRY